MDKELIRKLQSISSEEQEYLEGNKHVKKDIYTRGDTFEVDCKLLLREGKLVTIRPHSRFVEFPAHRHNYIEIMYVCQGTITHLIDGQELTMQAGDLLLLNQHVKHGIKKAEFDDVAINFIALPDFFDIPLQMLRKENAIADFLINIFRQYNHVSHYLLFQLKNEKTIENLIENMIRTILYDGVNEDAINQYSMGLIFLYLLEHLDRLTQNSSQNYNDVVLNTVTRYIDNHYQTAALSDLANEFHLPLSSLSKMIKQHTGVTFQELLIRKRCQKAAMFLLETNLTIEEIAETIGYENHSYFYRLFKKYYGMTPRKYRIQNKENR